MVMVVQEGHNTISNYAVLSLQSVAIYSVSYQGCSPPFQLFLVLEIEMEERRACRFGHISSSRKLSRFDSVDRLVHRSPRLRFEIDGAA
jgi:hypothetical protein